MFFWSIFCFFVSCNFRGFFFFVPQGGYSECESERERGREARQTGRQSVKTSKDREGRKKELKYSSTTRKGRKRQSIDFVDSFYEVCSLLTLPANVATSTQLAFFWLVSFICWFVLFVFLFVSFNLYLRFCLVVINGLVVVVGGFDDVVVLDYFCCLCCVGSWLLFGSFSCCFE